MADSEQSESSNPIYSSVLNNYSPIITKVDAPEEDAEKGDNEKNEHKVKTLDDCKMCSPSFPPKMDVPSNPFASTNNVKSGILKPPQLSVSSSNNTKKPFILNPSRLAVPITKGGMSTSDNGEDKKALVNGETPKFVPLLNENKTNSSSTTTVVSSNTSSSSFTSLSSSNSFVFGQNLEDRVVVENKPEEPKASTSFNSNGTTDMLFSNAIKHEVKVDANNSSKESKSLSESAREYEESRANKRKYDEVEVKTGEEEEMNILSISCKLFAYDKTSGSWQERGRGTLRLNDFEGENGRTQSRLVFRTSGSLRVILNTKIWAKMTVEKASDKSIRLTALDANGDIKIFLVMATIEDTKVLTSHLQTRVEKEEVAQKRNKSEEFNSHSEDD